MRDILSDPEKIEFFSDPNPMKRAQKQMLTPLVKRFYTDVSVGIQDGLHVVLLDGKPVKTPAKKPLAFATDAAAQLAAKEFAEQVKEINPAIMPITRLANTAIDGVSQEMDAVRAEIVRFAGNDLICYRAESPDALVARQAHVWDRYINWAKTKYDAKLYLAEGVMHVEQPKESLAALDHALKIYNDPLSLAVLHTMTTLTGSAIIALALATGEVSAADAWTDAHLDEEWTNEQWGIDTEAEARRAYRWLDMKAAVDVLKALQ